MARNNNNNNFNNNSSQTPRTNGSKFGFSQNIKQADGSPGGLWINAWNTSKGRGLIKLSGCENSRSKRYISGTNNKRHIMLFVEVFFTRTGNKHVEYIDFCIDSQTATLPQLGMFINCKTGKFTNLVNPKNYNR